MNVIEVQDLVKRYGDRSPSTASRSRSRKARSSGSSAPTARARPPRSSRSAGLRSPTAAPSACSGSIPRRDRDAAREQVGIQLQESELPTEARVREALDLYASFYRDPADTRRAARGPRPGREARQPRSGNLSGGQKQRLSIALALVGNPRIAILDELTTGLDPQARRDTWQLIEDVRARGVTVVLVTHFMDEAERLSDRIAMIDRGRLVALDTPAGIIARVERRAAPPVPAVRAARRRAPHRPAGGPLASSAAARS